VEFHDPLVGHDLDGTGRIHFAADADSERREKDALAQLEPAARELSAGATLVSLAPRYGTEVKTTTEFGPGGPVPEIGAAAELAAAVFQTPPGQAGPLVEGFLRRGAVGAAAEMLGAARRCLDMSVAYAKVREQFGQPIGSFQAIRHKCAEMLLEVENSHAATYYAAWALDAEADDAALAASVAKAYVGEAASRVCGEAIQVHGGIGFTWEYDLHLYMKRARALGAMYGDADYHRELITRRVAG